MARRKMKRESVQQAAQNWANGYAAAGPAIQQGVQNPTRDPTAAAIAAQNTMLANLTASVTNGTWANALRAAGLASWQQGMLQKTIPSLANRAQVGQQHYAAFMNCWLPGLNAQIQQLPARGTYQANKQRMNQLIDWMHSQRGKCRKAWRQGAGNVGGGTFGSGPVPFQG